MTPDERTQQIREREQKATPGPWVHMDNNTLFGEIRRCEDFCLIAEMPKGDDRTGDFEFMAQARQDVPWLLDQLAAANQRAEAAERDAAQLEIERDELKYRLQVWSDAHAEQLAESESVRNAALKQAAEAEQRRDSLKADMDRIATAVYPQKEGGFSYSVHFMIEEIIRLRQALIKIHEDEPVYDGKPDPRGCQMYCVRVKHAASAALAGTTAPADTPDDCLCDDYGKDLCVSHKPAPASFADGYRAGLEAAAERVLAKGYPLVCNIIRALLVKENPE